MGVKSDIRVEKIGFCPELLEHKSEWDALLDRSTWPTVYSTFDYVYTACSHFKEDEELSFLFLRAASSGELLAIFPLSFWEHEILGIEMRVVAHATTTTFTDVDKPYPIIHRDHNAACWQRFALYFRKEYTQWDMIDFDSTRSKTYYSKNLTKLFPRPNYCPKSITGPEYPVVRLDGEWSDFWDKHRTVRRKTRRIEKVIGEHLRYTITNDPADVERCLAEYTATEQLSWKTGQGVSQERNQIFYRALLPKLAAQGQVYFGMMYDDDIVMSAVIAFVYGKRLYFALCTYNPDYGYLSPGGVNWTRMVEYFHGKDLNEADFLSGGAGYIYPLADQIEQTRDILVYRMGWRNLAVALRYAAWQKKISRRRAQVRRRKKQAEKRGKPYHRKPLPTRYTLGIRVEKVYFSDALKAYAEEWEALLQRSSRPTIYSTFDYIETSCRHFKNKENIKFLFFRSEKDDQLLAIFPISIWEDLVYDVPIRTIEHGITTSFTDVDKPYPIIDRDHEALCWKRFRNYFAHEYHHWEVIIYDELFLGSYLNTALRKLFPSPAYYTKKTPGPESPIVALNGNWDAFEKKHPNMRKKSRRLENKIGEGFSYVVTSDPTDVERCLNEYIATEQAGWKANEGVSQENNQKFYHDLLPKLAAKGQLFFGMMYDGDQVISAEISYTYLDRVYFALGTYHPDYKKLSPGAVSTSRFIQYFYDKGYTEGDFLAGFAHYVNPWSSRREKTVDVVIRRMGAKNGYLALRHLLTKTKRKIKPLLKLK